jgi:zinc-finger of transposase IS204/IS1001/IS1096/IS1165
MLPITSFLFPSSSDLLLEEIICEGQTLFLSVRSSQETANCPDCATIAGKIHSQYVRTLADVPLMDYAVRLRVQVRRFFCCNPACHRKTFAERFPDLAQAYARRTHRHISRLSTIAKELGGRPGVRESTNARLPVSRHTLLRLLRHARLPAPPAPRMIGVDDWGATRSYRCSCKTPERRIFTWNSASSAEPSLNQVRLGQCSRI